MRLFRLIGIPVSWFSFLTVWLAPHDSIPYVDNALIRFAKGRRRMVQMSGSRFHSSSCSFHDPCRKVSSSLKLNIVFRIVPMIFVIPSTCHVHMDRAVSSFGLCCPPSPLLFACAMSRGPASMGSIEECELDSMCWLKVSKTVDVHPCEGPGCGRIERVKRVSWFCCRCWIQKCERENTHCRGPFCSQFLVGGRPTGGLAGEPIAPADSSAAPQPPGPPHPHLPTPEDCWWGRECWWRLRTPAEASTTCGKCGSPAAWVCQGLCEWCWMEDRELRGLGVCDGPFCRRLQWASRHGPPPPPPGAPPSHPPGAAPAAPAPAPLLALTNLNLPVKSPPTTAHPPAGPRAALAKQPPPPRQDAEEASAASATARTGAAVDSAVATRCRSCCCSRARCGGQQRILFFRCGILFCGSR